MLGKKLVLALGLVVCVSVSLFAATMTNYVVNVGQGDGALIITPSGKVIVIDGGDSTSTTSKMMAFLAKKAITTIDVLVLTHPHTDHLYGLTTILQNKIVKAVYDPKYPATTVAYTNFKNAVAAEGCPYYQSKTGDTYSWDSALSIKCLNARSSVSNVNNASVVLKITHGTNTLLWAGDAATSDTENNMVASYLSYLPAKFLKVGHHGSSTSSGATFLSKVAPRYSFISVGAGNSYGHPAAATLTRLTAAGSLIYRTDQKGSLRCSTNGTGTYTIALNQ